MILPGSYANGFAPRDGRPLYPQLWSGCVFAAAPMLGPTGVRLRDWSGSANHADLTNGPIWEPIAGWQAVTTDGVNDLLKCTSNTVGNLGTSHATVVVWCVLQNSNLFGPIIGKRNDGGVFQQWGLFQGHLNASLATVAGKKVSLFWYSGGGAASSQHVHTSADIADGKLHCVVARRVSGTTPTIWIDGIQQATTVIGSATTNINADGSTDPIRVGALADAGSYLAFNFIESRVYSRNVSDSEIRIVSSRPGIAYELAPRRRASSAVAFNRRRRLLVGAGS